MLHNVICDNSTIAVPISLLDETWYPIATAHMATINIPELTERLPPELLKKVLMYMPVRDILRMKQVRRIHDHVQRFQPNCLYIVSFTRSIVSLMISSRCLLMSSTVSIFSPQGWRITLP